MMKKYFTLFNLFHFGEKMFVELQLPINLRLEPCALPLSWLMTSVDVLYGLDGRIHINVLRILNSTFEYSVFHPGNR